MSRHLYALVLAGGSGTRLWPHSRSRKPKQFLALGNGGTMLQETVARSAELLAPEHVYVATNAGYVPLVAEQLPAVPPANILAEPAGRGTAPCIGLAALHLRRRDPDAVMVVLSADHAIAHPDRLNAALAAAAAIAQSGHLVTLGVLPTAPSTGYGYIQQGDALQHVKGQAAYRVRSFAEKPDRARAEAYLAGGDYFWNAGIFIWRADRILQELAAHRPVLAHALSLIDQAIDTPAYDSVLASVWNEIENVAIDIAVMERTGYAAVIPVDLGWSDVGDWAALADTLPQDEAGNAVIGSHIGVDTRNSLIFGNGRVVATIGVADLVIVDTHDALLICPRDRAQDVKTMVGWVRERREDLI
jgi:mannose-1-phosphate guanylyltransferase